MNGRLAGFVGTMTCADRRRVDANILMLSPLIKGVGWV